ncbi:AbiV family abortive infection protein [Bacillus cereus group sp. IBL03679]|uniref:AbiV family abortive infection protein n=1 Tax=Bacillus cereus group sp. IBL03679 TaxID=3240095 RepID=UPI003D2F750E
MKPLQIYDLKKAYIKIFNNAVSLVEESRILFSHKKYARSYTLSHIASEEISKLPIILEAASDVHKDVEINWKKIDKKMKNHKEKLKMRFFITALAGGRIEGINRMIVELAKIKPRINIYNDLKNESLYVSFSKEKLIIPNDIVDREMANASLVISKNYLALFKDSEIHLSDNFEKMIKENSASPMSQIIANIK